MDAGYYRVLCHQGNVPEDYLSLGFSSRQELSDAIELLIERWGDRVGECIARKHEFLRLRFRDTPDGWPEEKWLPRYLLESAEPPESRYTKPSDEEAELDRAFGFD